MVSKQWYIDYPADYRVREIKTLANWIRAGESGSVVGLAGAGISNILGFLCYRPEVVRSYLSGSVPKLALVLVDLNNLPGNNLSTFFRVILRALYETRPQLAAIEPELAVTVESLYRRVEEKSDPFMSQSALREALFLFQTEGVRLVLVLDRFDEFCRTVEPQILDNLRGLRDSFKATLSYLVGLRHKLTYLPKPTQMGDLYEILDTHVCWVGPMNPKDARWVIRQREKAMGASFTEEQCQRLIDLTGGYPALLRTASLWLGGIANNLPGSDIISWEEQLLAEPSLRSRLEDLRLGLTGAEEAALYALHEALAVTEARDRQKNLGQAQEKHKEVLVDLQAKQLCRQTEDGWRFFSPLFAKFIAGMESVSVGKIWCLAPAVDRFFRGEKELTGLSKKDCQLLHYFLDHLEEQPHSIDVLIDGAWPEADPSGVSSEAVQQAIRHLRKQIEPHPAKPRYLFNQHGLGYSFFPEGAPRG